jgi:hypothetical protein
MLTYADVCRIIPVVRTSLFQALPFDHKADKKSKGYSIYLLY